MTLNRPLIESIITQLIDHPEQHSQSAWGVQIQSCGTTHCVAGWAVALTPGVILDWVKVGGNGLVDDLEAVLLPGSDTYRDIDSAAAELMGISPEIAFVGEESLFYDFGDTDHIIGRLKDLLNEGATQ